MFQKSVFSFFYLSLSSTPFSFFMLLPGGNCATQRPWWFAFPLSFLFSLSFCLWRFCAKSNRRRSRRKTTRSSSSPEKETFNETMKSKLRPKRENVNYLRYIKGKLDVYVITKISFSFDIWKISLISNTISLSKDLFFLSPLLFIFKNVIRAEKTKIKKKVRQWKEEEKKRKRYLKLNQEREYCLQFHLC